MVGVRVRVRVYFLEKLISGVNRRSWVAGHACEPTGGNRTYVKHLRDEGAAVNIGKKKQKNKRASTAAAIELP